MIIVVGAELNIGRVEFRVVDEMTDRLGEVEGKVADVKSDHSIRLKMFLSSIASTVSR